MINGVLGAKDGMIDFWQEYYTGANNDRIVMGAMYGDK